ncbi:MAG: patatin-like phospholipase family protein [Bacteroidaceae bacterium]|nr:patatin-like phospholipase family protein [Bacteroidaceae bacterium]
MKNIKNLIFSLLAQYSKENKEQEPKPSKNIALVLSGGGARGYAHIGAIEVLLEKGYNITSISGTSMGALVGGIYAAGKIDELKDLVKTININKAFQIFDISLGTDHLATGKKIVKLIDELIGEDVKIENLKIPFCCCASDLVTGNEAVFRSGPLNTAIRASISIPCIFEPVYDGTHIYVDGSVHNTIPLDRVKRHDGDILVAVNVNAPDKSPNTSYLKKYTDSNNNKNSSFISKFLLKKSDFAVNYMNMLERVTTLFFQNNSQLALRLTPPDICAEIPMNAYNILEFNKAEEIIALGRESMKRALREYENKTIRNRQ